jgi:hypothetical protein
MKNEEFEEEIRRRNSKKKFEEEIRRRNSKNKGGT